MPIPNSGSRSVYTSRRVQEALKLCGVDEIHTGIGKTGVVAVIRGRSDTAAAAWSACAPTWTR